MHVGLTDNINDLDIAMGRSSLCLSDKYYQSNQHELSAIAHISSKYFSDVGRQPTDALQYVIAVTKPINTQTLRHHLLSAERGIGLYTKTLALTMMGVTNGDKH